MHLRFSSCIGLPVLEEGEEGVLGLVSGILIHPDTGKVEGFFVHGPMTRGANYFVSSMDILRWGTRVYVRNSNVISPAEDRIRLQPLLDDDRTVLDQKIVTESGVRVGRCKDVQFNTERMHIEWIFPRKWFRWGVALPVAEILEVRKDTIIIKDRLQKAKVSTATDTETTSVSMPELSEA